jgi:hypothetical protein
MDVPIVVAIVALVSTIVGATIGAATNYILAMRHERADRERDDRNHAVEVKRAARLMTEELTWVRTELSQWVTKKRWSSTTDMPLRSLSTEAREKYIHTIAPDLSDAAWESVTFALRAAESMRVIRSSMPSDRATAIPDDVAETFIPLIKDIDEGRLALAPYELDFHAASR